MEQYGVAEIIRGRRRLGNEREANEKERWLRDENNND